MIRQALFLSRRGARNALVALTQRDGSRLRVHKAVECSGEQGGGSEPSAGRGKHGRSGGAGAG